MNSEDEDILFTYITETKDHLVELENGILDLENNGAHLNQEMIHSMFRSAHSIKAGANLLKLKNIEQLSHVLENILQNIRQEKLVLTSEMVNVMLLALDTIGELVSHPELSDMANTSSLVSKLKQIEDS